jgi:hypothetical protein
MIVSLESTRYLPLPSALIVWWASTRARQQVHLVMTVNMANTPHSKVCPCARIAAVGNSYLKRVLPIRRNAPSVRQAHFRMQQQQQHARLAVRGRRQRRVHCHELTVIASPPTPATAGPLPGEKKGPAVKLAKTTSYPRSPGAKVVQQGLSVMAQTSGSAVKALFSTITSAKPVLNSLSVTERATSNANQVLICRPC